MISRLKAFPAPHISARGFPVSGVRKLSNRIVCVPEGREKRFPHDPDKEKGPRRDIVILNASAAIIVAGLADDFESAIKLAQESVSDGKASACLEKLIEVSNKV